jgi:hypothetical protein
LFALSAATRVGDLYDRVHGADVHVKLLGTTGRLALLLEFVGIYGAVSFAVAQRRREIGIRLALGVERGHLRRMLVWLAPGLPVVLATAAESPCR